MKIPKLKLHFTCYKKHKLTHLSLVIRTVLAYILFNHYNSPFTVTPIIKCIFDSEWLRFICFARMRATVLDHSRKPAPDSKKIYNIFAWLSNIYRYTHEMSVMYWGKQKVSNALNSITIFAVCHGGSIWSMISIKGWLRMSVHKLERLCEFTLLFM